MLMVLTDNNIDQNHFANIITISHNGLENKQPQWLRKCTCTVLQY